MNAAVRSPRLSAGSRPHTLAEELCPFLPLIKQIAEVAKASIIADGPGTDDANVLYDLERHLEAQAEWMTPQSIEGVLLIALMLPETIEDIRHAEDPIEAAKRKRILDRLLDRLIRGIIAVGGRRPVELGLDRYWAEPEPSAAAAAYDRAR